MKKNTYSLILFDEIVEAIDRMAYANNSNRSQLINDLLAEKVGLLTPELKIKHIFNELVIQLKNLNSIKVKRLEAGQVQLGTFIKYKYKPTIHFNIESCGTGYQKCLVLKVYSRTTSTDLSRYLNDFFEILSEIDKKRFLQLYKLTITNHTLRNSNNKFIREFLKMTALENLEQEYIVYYLMLYIKMLDEALRYYFNHLNSEDIKDQLDTIYCSYMKRLKQ